MIAKVIYVGQLWYGSTCLARSEVLRTRGCDLLPFDVTPYYNAGGRISRGIQHRLLAGPSVSRLNQDFLALVRRHERVDVIWVDKGTWLFPSILAEIKNLTRAICVHYTPDPAFTKHTSRHFRRALAYYDLCITTKRYEIDCYRQNGATRVVFCLQGVDGRFMECTECEEVAGSHRRGVAFVGHRERHYEKVLSVIAPMLGGDLRIRGPGWNTSRKCLRRFSSCDIGGSVWGDEYVLTLSRARIGLGLLSKYYPDQFTTRSFEIPAAGALLIAERTSEHLELFAEGSEAEFFSTANELGAKVAFYLRNEQRCAELAARGRARVVQHYTWEKVLSPAIHEIEGLLGRG